MTAGVCLVQEGDRWCRKAVAGAGRAAAGVYWCRKVAAGVCWCRKAVAGAGLEAAGAELVAASAGKWSPVQEW